MNHDNQRHWLFLFLLASCFWPAGNYVLLLCGIMMSGFVIPLLVRGVGYIIALQKHVQLLYLKNSQSKLALIYSHLFVSIYGNI